MFGTRISYGQHKEDVFIDHLFRNQESGFYVDVGASSPIDANVTYNLYQRGWSGLNIEPIPERHSELTALRPRDRSIRAAAGEAAGQATLYRAGGAGHLSTVHRDLLSERSIAYWPVQVEVVALADVLRAMDRPAIDLLKIDAEGAEAAVLRGLDLSSFQPRLILSEAVSPIDKSPAVNAWEPMLLDHGYSLVRNDGVNRFYFLESEEEIASNMLSWDESALSDWTSYSALGPPLGHEDHPLHEFAFRLARLLMDNKTETALEAIFECMIRDLNADVLANPFPSDKVHQRIRWCFERVFGRRPTGDELRTWSAASAGQTGAEVIRSMVRSDAFIRLFAHC